MRRAVSVVLMLTLAGCTNLGGVSSISTKLVNASSSWNDVGNEFKASCLRERQFDKTMSGPSATACATRIQASTDLTFFNGVLISYFKALGDAANSQNYNPQPGISDLGTSVKAIPGINQGEVDAAVGFFKDLAALAGNVLRERELRKLIDDGEPKAQAMITTLGNAVPVNLSTQLDAEKTRLGGSFSSFIADSGIDPPDPIESICQDDGPKSYPAATGIPPLKSTTYLAETEYCRHLSVITAKQNALDAYKQSLQTASAALKELASSKTKLGAKQLAQNLFTIGNQLNDDVTAINKAFAQPS